MIDELNDVGLSKLFMGVIFIHKDRPSLCMRCLEAFRGGRGGQVRIGLRFLVEYRVEYQDGLVRCYHDFEELILYNPEIHG